MESEIEDLIHASRQLRKERNADGLPLAEKAYHLSRSRNNLPLMRQALMEQVSYQFTLLANYQESARLANELLQITDVQDYPEEVARCWNMLGVQSDITGNYIAARDYYFNIIHLLEARKGLSKDGKSILANAYHNLCKLFTQIQASEEHEEFLQKALQLFEEIEDETGLARVWNLKAALLPDEVPVEERMKIFEQALVHFEKGTDRLGHASCLSNVGLCFCYLARFDEGLPLLTRAVEMLRESENKPMAAFALFQMAEAERMKGDTEIALQHLQQAEEILLQVGAKVHLNVVYREWAVNLAAQGDYQGAYHKMLQFIDQVTDRLNFDREAAVAQAKLKFELEKKEKESELLRKKNQEIELFNERLQQSNAELNQFAYAASHDLKEPLRMVSNYMQLLEKSLNGNLTEDQAAYIRFATDGAKRMYSLIDSLLLFSRATVDTALQTVDLNDVLDEVIRTVTSSSIRPVDVDAEPLPVVLADYHQMIQVFQNLLANSVKYNDKALVWIKVTAVTDATVHRITVADNGIGIAAHHRDKIFELFKRLHHKENYSGTGIGLSICKKIISQSGGRIWAEDSELGGIAFVFTLPVTG